jgi:hypothetical protein
MTPHIDGEHHTETPLLHDFEYDVVDGVPILRGNTDTHRDTHPWLY